MLFIPDTLSRKLDTNITKNDTWALILSENCRLSTNEKAVVEQYTAVSYKDGWGSSVMQWCTS